MKAEDVKVGGVYKVHGVMDHVVVLRIYGQADGADLDGQTVLWHKADKGSRINRWFLLIVRGRSSGTRPLTSFARHAKLVGEMGHEYLFPVD